ncbi:hypothetical protein, partial [Staphylococcus aureus]|uniref:hypothetical protein n=1 Tax=Staphylococcus aureus TaxID=1280 RepID=UPI001C82A555
KRGPFLGVFKTPKNFSPGGKIFSPGEKFLGPPFSPKKGEKPPGVFKTPGVFKKGAPFWGFLKNPPKIFSPGGKIFSPGGKNFLGAPLFSPQKGGKTPGGFLKTPRGFLKKGAPFLGGF